MKKKTMEINLLEYENNLYDSGIKYIAGVDEVGRGPLVGPVVAAAVILPRGYKLEGLTDSKKLSEKKRDEFYKIIMKDAVAVGVGVVSAKVAMKEAISKLAVKPEHVLIDAMPLNLNVPTTSIIKGDQKSESIAAASVIAKVTRDSMMYELSKDFPEYEFDKHKGYPTKKHIENVKKYGLLDIYRFTFKPISVLINEGGFHEGQIRQTNFKK